MKVLGNPNSDFHYLLRAKPGEIPSLPIATIKKEILFQATRHKFLG